MENREFKMSISPDVYNRLMETNLNVTQDSILSLLSHENELRESVNNWLCKTANQQKVSLFMLCDMFDIDIKREYEYDDKHSLNIVYDFVLIPKKNYATTVRCPHF